MTNNELMQQVVKITQDTLLMDDFYYIPNKQKKNHFHIVKYTNENDKYDQSKLTNERNEKIDVLLSHMQDRFQQNKDIYITGDLPVEAFIKQIFKLKPTPEQFTHIYERCLRGIGVNDVLKVIQFFHRDHVPALLCAKHITPEVLKISGNIKDFNNQLPYLAKTLERFPEKDENFKNIIFSILKTFKIVIDADDEVIQNFTLNNYRDLLPSKYWHELLPYFNKLQQVNNKTIDELFSPTNYPVQQINVYHDVLINCYPKILSAHDANNMLKKVLAVINSEKIAGIEHCLLHAQLTYQTIMVASSNEHAPPMDVFKKVLQGLMHEYNSVEKLQSGQMQQSFLYHYLQATIPENNSVVKRPKI